MVVLRGVVHLSSSISYLIFSRRVVRGLSVLETCIIMLLVFTNDYRGVPKTLQECQTNEGLYTYWVRARTPDPLGEGLTLLGGFHKTIFAVAPMPLRLSDRGLTWRIVSATVSLCIVDLNFGTGPSVTMHL